MATMESHPRRVYVFDTPRCCTHLFRKMFSAHPQLTQIDVPFFSPWRGPDGIAQLLLRNSDAEKTWEEDKAHLYLTSTLKGMTYSEARKKLMEAVQAVERGEPVGSPFGLPPLTTDPQPGGKGNVVWIQDHAVFNMQHGILLDVLRRPSNPHSRLGVSGVPSNENPTQLPDELIRTILPIFVIRNPVRSVYSMYKVQRDWTKHNPTDEPLYLLTSQAWARILFDWFQEQGREAIVIDADEIIQHTDEVAGAICKRVGISPSGVQQTWKSLPVDQQPPDDQMRFYMKEIWASSGIVRKEGNENDKVDLDAATAKWTAEFGDEIAQGLRQRVKTELVNYEYLRSFRLTP